MTNDDTMSQEQSHSTWNPEVLHLPAELDQALQEAERVEQLDGCVEDGPTITIVAWPGEHALLTRLREQGLPRLLLLAPGTLPPVAEDILEDWARLPVSIVDFRIRLDSLRRHARGRPPRPAVDGDGRLLYHDRWVGLSRLQEQVVRTLIAKFEQPVQTRDLLQRRGDGLATLDALRSCIYGLRRHLEPVRLEIVPVRNHGYLLRARP
jgi:hypothetical protein